jgi:hypothetical protein
MGTVILESVLFAALVAALAALFLLVLQEFTPVGRWIRQTQNRRRIERRQNLTCPIHGYHSESELVRLPGGARSCPQCYQEIVDDHVLQ